MSNEEMRNRINGAQLIVQVIMALFLALITGINGWAWLNIADLQQRVGVNETRLNAFLGEGPRYTEQDATRDLGVVTRLLELQGKEIDDHEGRIRTLERGKP